MKVLHLLVRSFATCAYKKVALVSYCFSCYVGSASFRKGFNEFHFLSTFQIHHQGTQSV